MPITPPNLPERLARIDGLNVETALRSANGNLALLERILRRFVSTYRRGVPSLLDVAGSENEMVNQWRLACHSLRGALSVIGATAVEDRVIELEKALRTLGSRASFIAMGRGVHEAVLALAARFASAMAATESRPAETAAKDGSASRRHPARLRELRRLMIVDTPPETEYDTIARDLATALQVPIALVNILDEDRDWFKAQVGLAMRESAVADSFCESFFETQSDLIAVEDTLTDQRFADNPFVRGMPFVRFYAASRLVVGGHLIGTLCAYDTRPKRVSGNDIDLLKTLGAKLTRLLEERPQ